MIKRGTVAWSLRMRFMTAIPLRGALLPQFTVESYRSVVHTVSPILVFSGALRWPPLSESTMR
jgi:hypothetical protein